MWAADDRADLRPAAEAAGQFRRCLGINAPRWRTTRRPSSRPPCLFSRRYPCRVVVLRYATPGSPPRTSCVRITAKCHPGRKPRRPALLREFVTAQLPARGARRFLENQVSTCFSTDLPVYYWAHNFSSASRLSAYQYLLHRQARAHRPPSALGRDEGRALALAQTRAVRDHSLRPVAAGAPDHRPVFERARASV